MISLSLKSLAFVFVLGVLLQSNLAECHSYNLIFSCGQCKDKQGCPNNTCVIGNGGPYKNRDFLCGSTQICEMYNTITITVTDVGCASNCTTSCCTIFYVNGQQTKRDCVPSSDVAQTCAFPDDSSTLSTGAIIGIAVGGFFALALIVGIVVYCIKKSKKDGDGYQQVQ